MIYLGLNISYKINMFQSLQDLSGKSSEESVRIIADYLRATQEELEYTLTHLDSSNVTELDLNKTTIYRGDNNEL